MLLRAQESRKIPNTNEKEILYYRGENITLSKHELKHARLYSSLLCNMHYTVSHCNSP